MATALLLFLEIAGSSIDRSTFVDWDLCISTPSFLDYEIRFLNSKLKWQKKIDIVNRKLDILVQKNIRKISNFQIHCLPVWCQSMCFLHN